VFQGKTKSRNNHGRQVMLCRSVFFAIEAGRPEPSGQKCRLQGDGDL